MVLFTASYYFQQMLGKIISCHKREHCLFKTLPQIKYYVHRNLFESIVCFYEEFFMMCNYFLIKHRSKIKKNNVHIQFLNYIFSKSFPKTLYQLAFSIATPKCFIQSESYALEIQCSFNLYFSDYGGLRIFLCILAI